MKYHSSEPVPVGQTYSADTGSNGGAAPKHDKEMTRRFLAGLDPNATRSTFQFFSD